MDCAFCQVPLPEESRFCMICGADLSDPEVSTRQRAAIKELFEAIKAAVQGRYRVTEMLGRGGMGAVFLAEDLRLGRMVALKVLRPELADESSFVGRFEREARIAARLDHPNIIPIYEVAQVGDFHYFAMKHVAGKSLDELVAGKTLPVEQAMDILWQAACGLGHAHRRGVIHRDVKPSNIMVDEGGRVLITDFGISKALESKTQYTSVGQMIGTPRYLSPEQAKGQPLDGRSDQYSLAVVGYEMIVGRLPLIADTVHALMYMHIYEVPTPARAVRPEIPSEISNALQRALAKEPDHRFPSMEEFAAALRPDREIESGRGSWTAAPGDEGVPHTTPPPPPTVPVRQRRWRRPVLIGTAAAALVAVGLAVGALGDRSEEPPVSVESDGPADSSAPASSPANETVTGSAGAAEKAAEPPPDSTAPPAEAAPASPRPKRPPRSNPAPARAPAPAVDTAAAPKAAAGYLTVNAVPYGTVSIDGVEVGDTPVFRHELSPGVHSIRIARSGFRADTSSVTITAGNEVRVSRTLVRETR